MAAMFADLLKKQQWSNHSDHGGSKARDCQCIKKEGCKPRVTSNPLPMVVNDVHEIVVPFGVKKETKSLDKKKHKRQEGRVKVE